MWYCVTTSISKVDKKCSLKSGAIKQNAKTITVTGAYSDENLIVSLRSEGGTLLSQSSGTGSVTLNVSTLDADDKEGCYLEINHARTCTRDNMWEMASHGWDSYPSALSVSSTSTVSKITVTY